MSRRKQSRSIQSAGRGSVLVIAMLLLSSASLRAVSYTHLTLPTTPYV